MKFLAAIEKRRAPTHRDRDYVEENGLLNRQIREAKAKAARAFDDGFAAAVDMVRRGASLEQLYGAMRGYEAELPQISRLGTREFAPHEPDPEDTRVAIPVEMWESNEKTEPMVLIPLAPEEP